MLNQIKNFFDQYLNSADSPEDFENDLKLAAAVLFVEMMTMDDEVVSKEQTEVNALLKEKFALSDKQADELLELAEQQRKAATDYFQFTSMINKNYSQEQKILLIKMLWKIAYADGVLDLNEEYFVRKIADLLYVPHSAFIQTKNQVAEHIVK